MRRVRAASTAALALLVGVPAATTPGLQEYGVVLVVVLVLGALVVAVRTWATDCFCARVASGLLAALVLTGQVLVSAVGLPGRPAAPWHAADVAVVVLSVVILLLALGRAAAPTPVDAGEHPYAL